MDEELSTLQLNQTWTLTSLPAGQKPIGCKWVYKIKYNSDGTVDRYKVRLVAKGYTQIVGVNYSETFSPTTKLTTLRCLLTIAAARNWFTQQFKTYYSLFTRHNNSSFTVLLIYVDDILLTGNDLTEIQCVKDCLLQQFRIKDLGDLKYFLGIEFSRSKAGIYMSQRKYALDILQDTGLT